MTERKCAVCTIYPPHVELQNKVSHAHCASEGFTKLACSPIDILRELQLFFIPFSLNVLKLNVLFSTFLKPLCRFLTLFCGLLVLRDFE